MWNFHNLIRTFNSHVQHLHLICSRIQYTLQGSKGYIESHNYNWLLINTLIYTTSKDVLPLNKDLAGSNSNLMKDSIQSGMNVSLLHWLIVYHLIGKESNSLLVPF